MDSEEDEREEEDEDLARTSGSPDRQAIHARSRKSCIPMHGLPI